MSVLTPSRSFYGLRHGATDCKSRATFPGTDRQSAQHGWHYEKAHAAAEVLRSVGISCILTSPLVRAAKTAEIIAAAISAPLTIEDGIIECDFGSFEGLSVRAAMDGVSSEEGLISILPADGEAWAVVTERSLALARHPHEHILFVCHDAVMQALLRVRCAAVRTATARPFATCPHRRGGASRNFATEGRCSPRPPAT